MPKLGYNELAWPTQIIAHSKKLGQCQAGSIVRNGCDSGDPLSRGTFFMKPNSEDRWVYFNPKTGGANEGGGFQEHVDWFHADQIFLPVEIITPQRVAEFRRDLELLEAVVLPAGEVFAEVLGVDFRICEDITERVRVYTADDDDYDYYDEPEYEENHTFKPIPDEKVEQAWLAAVKAVLDGQQ